MRLDKWLWAARFYKTRSLAAQAIEAGQARVNDARVKPAHIVKHGEHISLRKLGLEWNVEVMGLSEKRGGAAEAAKLYRESPASIAAREEELARRKAPRPGPVGQPNAIGGSYRSFSMSLEALLSDQQSRRLAKSRINSGC